MCAEVPRYPSSPPWTAVVMLDLWQGAMRRLQRGQSSGCDRKQSFNDRNFDQFDLPIGVRLLYF